MRVSIRLFFLFLVGISLIGLSSANGLKIESDVISINKTNTIDVYFNITIINQETFTFYNISSQNPIVIFDSFDLQSGENKTIQAKISSNENFNGDIRIVGDYHANLGISNETELITISSNGVDICNIDLIQGDRIIWKNTLLGEVKLKNLNSDEYFATILGSDNYTSNFQSEIEFNYRVYKTGLPISNVCHLNIRPSVGFVHSSQYDGIIKLNLKINYEPTSISTTFLTNSYIIDYNSQREDIFKITNTGNRVAKNINLSGDWFEFNENNFDLGIGDSKNIGYKIKPLILETSQTNITHNKTIKIRGNFNDFDKQINVFINYKNLNGTYGNSSYDKEYLKNVVNLFCSMFPDDCPKTVIYGNESDRNVTFVINEETYRENIIAEDMFREEVRSTLNLQNEKLILLEDGATIYLDNSNKTSSDMKTLSEETKKLFSLIALGFVVFLSGAIVIITLVILFNEKGKLKLKKMFHKGELH